MPQIDIDDEVFAILQSQAEPFVDTPNDVLRRLVGLAPDAPNGNGTHTKLKPIKRYRNRKRGDLMTLIETGALEVDDLLIYQKRTGEEFRGTVTNDGWIEAIGTTYYSPSGALKQLVGYEVNGWKHWTVARTGKLLDDYREN